MRGPALAELALAAPAMTRPDDRLRLEIEYGNVYQNLDDQPRAVTAFERARAAKRRARPAARCRSA